MARWYTSNLFIAGLLCISTATVYHPVSQFEFVNLDDETYVWKNPHVLAGLSAENLWWALTTTHAWNWHPLTWASLQLDAAFWGTNRPGGFHVTNLLLHIANTTLLFLVLRRMTKAVWQSAIVAALFGLHPLHVESVAWVTERKDVLSTFFWILTMAGYHWFIERPRPERYFLVLLTFSLGLIAKPMLVTLPCVLMLLDYWPLQLIARGSSLSERPRKAKDVETASTWKLLAQKMPLFTLSAASAVITVYAQKNALRSTEELSLAQRIGHSCWSYIIYVEKLVWPANLSVFYSYDRELALLWQMTAAAVLVCVSLFVIWRRNERYLFVGWFWYLGTLLPVIGIVQVGMQGMADRYTYVPSIGLFIAAVWGLDELAWALAIPRRILGFLAVFALMACGIATRFQVNHWENSITLWEHAIRVADSSLAHRNLGSCLARQGNDQKALEQYELAVACDPSDAESRVHLAAMLAKNQRLGEAVVQYQQALRIRPDVAEWHSYLAGVFLRMGMTKEAINHLREAVQLKPEMAQVRLTLGEELAKLGQHEEAARHLEEAYRLMPELRR
jgi:tetratricopeptide (TPR) repeat protein